MRASKRAWWTAVLLWVGGACVSPPLAEADQAAGEFLAPFLLTRDFALETLALVRPQKVQEPVGTLGDGAGASAGRVIPNLERPRAPSDRPPGLVPFARHIRDAAGQFGVAPNLIRAVILAESRGDHLAVSPRGARGLMQILPSTGRELGVPRADDLFHPRTNIFVGTQYLAQLLSQSNGDVRKALASYNAGPGAVAEGQNLPAETREFVPRVLRLWAQLRNSGP